MKPIVSRAVKMENHNPSPVAQEAYDDLKSFLGPDTTTAFGEDEGALIATYIADWFDRWSGFGKSTHKELIYTLYFVAEGLVPVWLGGDKLPERVTKKSMDIVPREGKVTPPPSVVDDTPGWAKLTSQR